MKCETSATYVVGSVLLDFIVILQFDCMQVHYVCERVCVCLYAPWLGVIIATLNVLISMNMPRKL